MRHTFFSIIFYVFKCKLFLLSRPRLFLFPLYVTPSFYSLASPQTIGLSAYFSTRFQYRSQLYDHTLADPTVFNSNINHRYYSKSRASANDQLRLVWFG